MCVCVGGNLVDLSPYSLSLFGKASFRLNHFHISISVGKGGGEGLIYLIYLIYPNFLFIPLS